MLRLVTTNNVEVFRHLGSALFQRLDVRHTVVSTYDEAGTRIAELKPDIAIVDVELAGGSGFELCRALKADPETRSIHVILLLSSVISRRDLERIQYCGCDDVLALPIQTDEFYHHIAQLSGLPIRRHHRVGVMVALEIDGDPNPLLGTVFNVSPVGFGCQLNGALNGSLRQGMTVSFRLEHDGQTTPKSSAEIIWTDESELHEELMAGLALEDNVPPETRVLLERLALFDVAPTPPDSPMSPGVAVALQGDFNELTRFDALGERLSNETRIDFNASAVRYISSAGVHAWCQFLNALSDGASYIFRHCSVAFASQAAMVPMFLGRGSIASLEAPYLCESCDREEVRLLEIKSLSVQGDEIIPPQLTCHTCGGDLIFDDLPVRYFAFLISQA